MDNKTTATTKPTAAAANLGIALVAEDNALLGEDWENWLGQTGFAVVRTTSKADALIAFLLMTQTEGKAAALAALKQVLQALDTRGEPVVARQDALAVLERVLQAQKNPFALEKFQKTTSTPGGLNLLGALKNMTLETDETTALDQFQKQFQATPLTLVVLDIRMPDAGKGAINNKAGLEAAVEMRRLEPTVPILFLTAGNESGIEGKALRLGPVNITDFARKVDDSCDRDGFQYRARRLARKVARKAPLLPPFVLDKEMRTISGAACAGAIHLPGQILDLAAAFDDNKDTVLTRKQLLKLWCRRKNWKESCLDDRLSKLRKILGDTERTLIETIDADDDAPRGTSSRYIYNTKPPPE